MMKIVIWVIFLVIIISFVLRDCVVLRYAFVWKWLKICLLVFMNCPPGRNWLIKWLKVSTNHFWFSIGLCVHHLLKLFSFPHFEYSGISEWSCIMFYNECICFWITFLKESYSKEPLVTTLRNGAEGEPLHQSILLVSVSHVVYWAESISDVLVNEVE